jgi:23S rRNA (adenine2503-C2)-methyltransferase
MTIEYVLLGGVNTGAGAARETAKIARRLEANVNLIEYNPCPDIRFRPPKTQETHRFRTWLEEDGVSVAIRFRRGRDIAAGCGQLAGRRGTAQDAKDAKNGNG